MKKFFGIAMMLGLGCLCFGFKTVEPAQAPVAQAVISEMPQADELSGGACGYDDQCTHLVAHACNQVINGHHYTPSLHADSSTYYYKVPCAFQVCGSNIPPPIGLVLPARRTAPMSYDIPSTCSDGLPCYHLACDESKGYTTLYRLEM